MSSHSVPETENRAARRRRNSLRQKFDILRKKLNWLKWRYRLTPWERTIKARYSRSKDANHGAPLVVVQCVEDMFYFCLFGELIEALRRHQSIRVEQLVPRSLWTPVKGTGWRFLTGTAGDLLTSNIFTDWKWIKIFSTYVNGIAYCSAKPLFPWQEISIAFEAHRLWKGLKTKDELIAMTMRGIPVGDLVADTYMRWRPSPALKLDDPFLRAVIRQSLRDIHRAFDYFGRKRPTLFLTSYTSYVKHGVPARVAAHLGIHVQSFGSYWDFSKRITADDTIHQRKFSGYADAFSRMDDAEGKIAQGGAMLEGRLRGKIDDGIAYMKKSSYTNPAASIPDMQGAVVIFLHDFYDSLHAYEWMVFHDFWEWICFTIEVLEAKNIPVFLKQHPNEVSDSDADVARLMALYPGLKLLPADVSNRQLVDAGMSCAVTVYGSVTAEMAFMGVPTINSGDNPHISFGFGLTARSREEYMAMLEGHAGLPRDIDRLRREAGAFYYMHFLNLPPDDADIRDKFIRNVRNIYATDNSVENAKSILADFQDLSASPGFQAFVTGLSHAIQVSATCRRRRAS